MNYGKRRLLFLTELQIKEGWISTRHMPDRRARRRFTVKQWAKFNVEQQMYLTKIFHIILTDHKTTRERFAGIAKAIVRPTPIQRVQQKQKLNHTIEKIQSGIDKFDEGMEQFSKGLNSSVSKGHRDDPVELVFGKRNQTKKGKHSKTKEPDPAERIMGKPTKDKYRALTG